MAEQRPENLVERLRARDAEAFNELVRLFHGSVYRLAFRLLRHADDAQEAAQDTFLAAYQGIAGFQERAGVRTWLLSIAYRKAVDRLKRRTEESHVASGMLDEEALWKIARNVDDLTDWGDNPEQTFGYQQLNDHLHAALDKLPVEARAVFELRDLQGLSTREAAEVLGIAEGAVRVRLHRVRQFLMRELQALFGERGIRK